MIVSYGMALVLGILYLLFLLWYGGRGKPLTQAEIDGFFLALQRHPGPAPDPALLTSLRELLAGDDGREFVMQNLVRYRARAQYPQGHPNADDPDPRAADRRYGRAIVRPLLRRASLPLFIARRQGRFIEPEGGAPDWHYVAMVRYRSRRDFLRFAQEIEGNDIAVHKWAAIETTHVFPVQPLVSLVLVRTAVGVSLALLWLVMHALIT